MIKRNKKGQFIKGQKPVAGFVKGVLVKEKHPMWKGGFPKCSVCGKELKNRYSKNCHKHSFSKERITKIKNGAEKRKGKNHFLWKGSKVGYNALHKWVERERGIPSKCEHCSSTKESKYHWANVSRKYLRKLDDWIRLCSKCHGKFDTGSNRRKLKTINK